MSGGISYTASAMERERELKIKKSRGYIEQLLERPECDSEG